MAAQGLTRGVWEHVAAGGLLIRKINEDSSHGR